MRALLAALAVAGLAALASPARAEPATTEIKGWQVMCDAPVCRASLPSVSGLQALMIGRFELGDGLSVGLATPGAIADRDRPLAMRIDGRPVSDIEPKSGHAPFEKVENLWLVDGRTVDQILAARGTAKKLRFEYIDVAGAPHDADFDLAALADVLAWMDARLGRSSAKLVGTAPRGLLAAPEVSRGELVVRQGVPPRLLAKHMAASECEAPTSPLLRSFKPVIGVLSQTAILYAVPCTASAGNVSFRLWVVESGEIGGITPLYFATFDGALGWKGTDLLHNVAYDDKTQKLTSTFRAAGCGARGVWHWKKWAFEMLETRVATECADGRDPAEWPLVWSPDRR